MHRLLAGVSVLVATKPAELTTGLRMLEVMVIEQSLGSAQN